MPEGHRRVASRRAEVRALDDVLACIKAGRRIQRTDIASLIVHMNASSIARAMSLYTSRSTAPTDAGVGWRTHSGPPDAQRTRTAKLVVNAVLSALQSRRASPQDIVPWVDAFRLAMGTLVACGTAATELAPVALSVIRRLADAHMPDHALTELVALRACVQATWSYDASVHEPGAAARRLRASLTYTCTEVSAADVSIVLDAYACALYVAPSVLDTPTPLWEAWTSVQAWSQHARAVRLDAACDRVAFMAERAVAQLAPPTSVDALSLRMSSLQLLMPVADVDAEALWDRAAALVTQHGIDASHDALAQMHEAAKQYQRAHGPAFERVMAWCARAAHAAEAVSAPSNSPAPSWSACLEALATRTPGPIPTTSAPRDMVPLVTPHIRAMLRASSVPATLYALRVLRRVDCEATCREGVRAACALAQRVFRERDVSSLDTCIEAFACVQHAPPSAQRTLSTHLFHYGSRLYADKAYAQAARFVEMACTCLAHAHDEASRLTLVRQYHVLAGAYQHMSQFRGAYDAYVAGLRHAKPTDDALELVRRVVRGAHHVSVFALLDPHRLLAELEAWPAAPRVALHAYLLDELLPMLQRDGAQRAYEAVCAASLPLLSHAEPSVQLHILLRHAELLLLQRADVDWAPIEQRLRGAPADLVSTYHMLAALHAIHAHAYDEAVSHVRRAQPAPDAPRPRARRAGATIPAPTPATPPPPAGGELREPSPSRAASSLMVLVADAFLHAGQLLPCLATLRHAREPVRLAEVLVSLDAADAAMDALHGHETSSARARLVHAHIEAVRGHAARAASLYDAAIDAADAPLPDAPAWERVGDKAALWDTQAYAADVYAAVSMAQGDMPEALQGALHALRTRLRLAMLLAQTAAPPPQDDDDDVFSAPSTSTSTPSARPPAGRLMARRMAGLLWRTAYALCASYERLSRLYARRGAVRDAEAFAKECVDMARGTSPGLLAGAQAWHAEWAASCGDTAQAAQLAADVADHPHAAFVLDTLAGDGAFDRTAACLDRLQREAGVRLLRALHERLVCARAMLAHDPAMVTGLDASPALAVYAQLRLAEARAALQSDPVYGMLPDMARCLPQPAMTKRATHRHVHALLTDAHTAGARVMADASADVATMRTALACVRDAVVLAASIGRPLRDDSAAYACALTHAAVSVSVRRACADAATRRAARPAARWLRRADAPPPCSEVVAPPAPPLDAHTAALVVSLSSDERELIVARYGDAYEPSVHLLPLHRQSRRDADDDDEAVLSVEAVMTELRRLVHDSNVGVQGAKDVTALDARKAWWSHRRALDAELCALLTQVQDAWFSGLQGLLAPLPRQHTLPGLHRRLEAIVRRACPARTRTPIALPDMAVATLAAMPATYRDDDLEDWLHYALDTLQLSGVPVAQDEVDLDELCVDVRSALDEYHAKQAAPHPHHTYLVLDRHLCELPWESLPILRSQSVTRLTALDACPTAPLELRACSTAYLLNPSGDLTRSEDRFAPALRAHPSWHGTIGHAPLPHQVAQDLASHDTFLYFGHSGAEMYVHPARLRELERCAATMLWGCSSGALEVHGVYDPIGTPYQYAVAQCPALLAALWDTTDRELDGVCEAVLEYVGLFSTNDPHTRMSLPEALVAARSQCKLPYLTGAACVVYGAPVVWSS